MITLRFPEVFLGPIARMMGLGLGVGFGIAFGAWLLAPWPVAALVGTQQMLTGGQSTSNGSTHYVSPGTPFNNTINSVAPGMGETAVSLPMFKGKAITLLVNLTTGASPTGGTFVVKVRKNGADTNLRCTLTQSGTCVDHSDVAFAKGSLLSIQSINTLENSGVSQYTYVLKYE